MKYLKFTKSKQLLAIVLSVLLVSACNTGGEAMTSKNNIRTKCIDGVTYIIFRESVGNQGHGYMSVKFDVDSKVVTCAY